MRQSRRTGPLGFWAAGLLVALIPSAKLIVHAGGFDRPRAERALRFLNLYHAASTSGGACSTRRLKYSGIGQEVSLPSGSLVTQTTTTFPRAATNV
jgi:hypothetical protein